MVKLLVALPLFYPHLLLKDFIPCFAVVRTSCVSEMTLFGSSPLMEDIIMSEHNNIDAKSL